MRQTSFAEMRCSLARSLDVIGDWWSPLTLRDIQLGLTRFDELATDIGISRGLLVAQLEAMIDDAVIEKVEYQQHPARYEYRLAAAPLELVPLLLALTAWGDRWRSPGEPPIVARHRCGSTTVPAIVCADCGEPITDQNMSFAVGPDGRTAKGTMLVGDLLMTGAPRSRPGNARPKPGTPSNRNCSRTSSAC